MARNRESYAHPELELLFEKVEENGEDDAESEQGESRSPPGQFEGPQGQTTQDGRLIRGPQGSEAGLSRLFHSLDRFVHRGAGPAENHRSAEIVL